MDFFLNLSLNFSDYMESNSIALPLTAASIDLLQKYRPVISIPLEVPSYHTDIKGLCRLRGMLQDQEEPELSLKYYVHQSKLHSTYYRSHLSHSEGHFLEGVFIQRYPIVLVPVPGEETNEGDLPKVILYEEMGEHLIVSSILDMVGIVENGEFHAIKFQNRVIYEEIPVCREEVLQGLEICMGDSLAAELTLYVLLSKIQERSALIGALPFNFSNVQNEIDALVISNSLKKLVRTVVLPIDLQFLNSQSLTPTKNLDTEKLENLNLQLPNHTLLILDESKLSPGNLTAKGIENLNIIIQLIQSQQITYDFGYSKINFPTDLRIISLSNSKSLFKIQNSLKLEGSREEFDFNLKHKLYIEATSQLEVTLPAEITSVAQEHFVKKRKEGKMTVEKLHLLLILTRYVTQSFGEKTCRLRDWEHALRLVTRIEDPMRNN